MRRISLLAATGVLLVGGATGMVAIADDNPGKSGDRGRSAEAPGQAADKGGGKGYGPPSWAHAGGEGKADRAARHAWKEAWQGLTEAERKDRMKQLASEHEAGMKAFGACVKAARGKPADCEKPLPPGQAKKQS